MNSEEPAAFWLVFYCEGLPGLPGGLKKALRGSQGLWVGLLIVGYLSASQFEIQGPDTGKGEKIPPGVEGLVRLGGKTSHKSLQAVLRHIQSNITTIQGNGSVIRTAHFVGYLLPFQPLAS